MLTLLMIALLIHLNLKKKITDNTQRWYKGCWNNGTTEIFEWILEYIWRTLEKSLIPSEKNLDRN